jgi:hypothetical protein
MRNLTTSVSFSLTFLALAYGAACSGSTTKSDAGVPVVDAAREAAPVVDAAADASERVCKDAGVDDLPVPDASVGDSGVSTGQCFQCLKTTCQGELSACNSNCDCRGAIVEFLGCTPKATSPSAAQACAINAFSSISGPASDLGTNLGRCALVGCRTECIPEGLLDAGPRDATTDADAQ